MAMTTTRITGFSSQANYGYYADVLVWDTIQSGNTFKVMVNTYIVNNGSKFNSSGWHEHSRIDQANSPSQRDLYSQSINTTGADRYGGETLIQSETFYVPITKTTMYVVSYLSKSGYASYEPGYCELSGDVSLPKVQSTWNSSLISIPDITQSFTLPINKYVSSYYNVVEVRNSNNTILVKTINDAVNSTSVTFDNTELNTIYTMDNNANQLPLRFYLDLKTYTNSSKTTQIGTTQRTTCEAFLVNSEPTTSTSVVEQDANVITLLGSSTSTKIIKNASDLLFTTSATAKNGATISSVKVNDASATLDSGSYKLNIANITTGTFTIITTDSRGLTTTETITKTLLDYIAVNINSTWQVERASQVSSDLVLNAVIDCYSSTIDGNTNTPVVQYSIDGTNWTTISSSSYTFTDDKITISNLTLSNIISYQNVGTFYLKCTDLLSSYQDNRQIAKGIETFSYGESDFQINGDLFIADENGDNVKNVFDIVKWTLLGSKTGDTSIDLPSSFNEIYCDIIIGGAYNVHIPIIISYQALSSNINGFNNGYYAGSNTNAHGRIQATTTSAKCSEASLNNTNYLSTTTINYYYR